MMKHLNLLVLNVTFAYHAVAAAATFVPTTSVAASQSSLAAYWDTYVGPVASGVVTTTASPTLVPSADLIPPPPLYYPPFPTGHEEKASCSDPSLKLPSDFLWGVAGAAFQVEGAVKDEGRGPSVWDVLTHKVPGLIADNSTADVADNHYYFYKQDIARIAALGAKLYSLSISWTRIFPYGSGSINEEGLQHYEDVIDTCLQYGVEPVVTLFHWDVPLFLQNSYGGFLSENIVADFDTYASVVVKRFHKKVSKWFTINEPPVFCGVQVYPLPDGYFTNTTVAANEQAYYCAQNVLLAHAEAYHTIKAINSSLIVSFKNAGFYPVAATNTSEDLLARQRALEFSEALYAHPVWLGGDYPESVKQYVSTFLPDLTEAQKERINGTADVLAYDGYTTVLVSAPEDGVAACASNISHPLYPVCTVSSYTYPGTEWPIGAPADPGAAWLYSTTDWVPSLLHYLQETYHPRGGILISEFGFAQAFEGMLTSRPAILTDVVRGAYFAGYVDGIALAVREGVNVVGCIAWGIFDNFEWKSGLSSRFGLQYVNYTSQERYYKRSFFDLRSKIEGYMLG